MTLAYTVRIPPRPGCMRHVSIGIYADGDTVDPEFQRYELMPHNDNMDANVFVRRGDTVRVTLTDVDMDKAMLGATTVFAFVAGKGLLPEGLNILSLTEG